MSAIVVVADAAAPQRSAALASRLQLLLVASPAELPADCAAWLGYADGRLQLLPRDARQSGPITVDFGDGASRWRLQGGAELIARAVAGRSKQPLRVLDATAGLGRDSFVLAGRGFRVHMLERSPVLAALLEDALERARGDADPRIHEIAGRLSLQRIDAQDYLEELMGLDELRGLDAPMSAGGLAESRRPDVIYLDPMFPPSQKAALVKKEMRLLQQVLHGDEADYAALLATARRVARLRVVVKRPRKAEPLAAAPADYRLEGKAVRFDVYVA